VTTEIMFGTDVTSGTDTEAPTARLTGNTEIRQEVSRTEVN